MGRGLLLEQVRPEMPDPLSRWELRQVAGLYQPIGLVTPAKQEGAILVRKVYSAVMTRAEAGRNQRDGLQDPQKNIKRKSQWEKPRADQTPTRNLTGETVKDPVEVKRFSSLQKRVRVIAWVWRAARKWLEIKDQPRAESKLEVIWHTRNGDVAVGDVVWLADQNALRGHYKLARVVSVNTDGEGIVRDVDVRTFPSYLVPAMKHEVYGGYKGQPSKIPATILHRDVRRLVILLPVEEQQVVKKRRKVKNWCELLGLETRSSSVETKVNIERKIIISDKNGRINNYLYVFSFRLLLLL